MPVLALVLLGAMDCLTTTIGILYFGAVEANPFIVSLTATNLPAFVVIKLAVIILAALVFSKAEKILMKVHDKNSKAFVRTRHLLRGIYAAVVVFLLIGVLNNIIVIIRMA